MSKRPKKPPAAGAEPPDKKRLSEKTKVVPFKAEAVAPSEQARALNELATRKGVTPPPVAPEGAEDGDFDPVAEAKTMDLWRLGEAGGRLFLPAKNDSWNEINKNELMLELKARGVSSAKKEDGSMSDAHRLILHVQRERNIDFPMHSLAGRKAGIYEFHGDRILVRKGYAPILPVPGEFPTIRGLIESILKPAEGRDLSPCFYGWLKVAYESLRADSFRVGQILYLIGPANCGKSRLQHQIITPLLGNRAADPLKYLTGRTEFNADIVGAEHLLVEDPDISPDFKERDIWGKRCKQIAANDSQRLHSKGKDAITILPFWRVSITQNDEQNSIDMLPPMEVFADKVIMLHCRRPDPERFRLPDTDEERIIFRKKCAEEMPAFAAWLLEYEIPEGYTSDRYGVSSYIDPWITMQLAAHSRETALLECIDMEVFKDEDPIINEDSDGKIKGHWQDQNTWKGNATELSNLLTGESSTCRRQVSGLFKSSVPLGKLLKSLSEIRPDRVKVAPAQVHTRGYFLYRAKPDRD